MARPQVPYLLQHWCEGRSGNRAIQQPRKKLGRMRSKFRAQPRSGNYVERASRTGCPAERKPQRPWQRVITHRRLRKSIAFRFGSGEDAEKSDSNLRSYDANRRFPPCEPPRRGCALKIPTRVQEINRELYQNFNL